MKEDTTTEISEVNNDNKEINTETLPTIKEHFLDKVGRVVSKGANHIVNNVAMPALKEKMKEGFKKVFLKSTIKYLIIFLGIFIVIFNPFKFFVSHLIASVMFLGVFTWSLISAIKVTINYYKLPLFCIKKKSIHDGSWQFIEVKWPKIAKGITGYSMVRNIACLFSKNFEDMPEVSNTVKDFIRYILKDIIVFCSFFALYFITVQFIAKPLLLMKYAGLRTWEVYLFPFVQIKNFIVYLFTL